MNRRPALMVAVPLVLGVGMLVTLGVRNTFSAVSRPLSCCHSLQVAAARPLASADATVTPIHPLNTWEVREEFNATSDKVRIVALLSPTCPGCEAGHAVVARVLRKFSSPKLQAILVWEPMLQGDSPAAASKQAETVQDSRIFQGWNERKNLGQLFGETLGMHGSDNVAWDVYLLYKPGIKWEGQQPPPPTFYMHQLTELNPKLLLCADPTELSLQVGKLLGQTN